MKRLGTILFVIFTIILFLNLTVSDSIKACKDIVACGDATAGDYNLLLKVRDPSRSGLQVLCIVPEAYEYTYRHPWTGKDMKFETKYKFIGVVTEGDAIPNIVKAGMTLSHAGIAYADSDTGSRWINPTRNAWDDFDWIRYACQTANTEDEAVQLLTEDSVKKMHATGVSENLFVVGPDKGFVVEGDAFHYKVEEIINGVSVRHNYPTLLWNTQRLKLFPISRSFDTVVEKSVRKMGVVRLGSIYGVRAVEIGEDYVDVKPVGMLHTLKTNNVGVVTKIKLGERESVGEFSVKLVEINGNKAKLSVCNIYKAWEDEMMKYIQPKYGSITVNDMIDWSRLTSEDLNGLRGMSQSSREYEAVSIYKIPKYDYEELSMGWFSPNHARSSIYVPFHICDTEIYDPYETGEAAALSLDLLDAYGHDVLTPYFSNVEEVFLHEIEVAEDISTEIISDHEKLSSFFNIVDMGMQRQALLTEQLWLELNQTSSQPLMDVVGSLWKHNYSTSLKSMNSTIHDIQELSTSTVFIDAIGDIAQDICQSRIDVARILEMSTEKAEQEYQTGKTLFDQGKYSSAFSHLERSFEYADMAIKGSAPVSLDGRMLEDEQLDFPVQVMIILLMIGVIFVIWAFRPK